MLVGGCSSACVACFACSAYSACKVLRLKVGLWNLISLGGSICMQIVWQGAIIFEYYLNMFEFNYFIFFLIKSQISYFLASNSRTKGIISYIIY